MELLKIHQIEAYVYSYNLNQMASKIVMKSTNIFCNATIALPNISGCVASELFIKVQHRIVDLLDLSLPPHTTHPLQLYFE